MHIWNRSLLKFSFENQTFSHNEFDSKYFPDFKNVLSDKSVECTVNLVTENMGLETPENLAWPNFFGTGRISWVIPIIKEKWGYKPPPPQITQ